MLCFLFVPMQVDKVLRTMLEHAGHELANEADEAQYEYRSQFMLDFDGF